MLLRCKHRKGQGTIKNLTSDSLVSDLMTELATISGVSLERMVVRKGFPPTTLHLPPDVMTMTLTEVAVQSGDILTIDESIVPQPPPITIDHGAVTSLLEAQAGSDMVLLTRVTVPADNSCLFTSFNFAISGGKMDQTCGPTYRSLVAGLVLSDPETYTEGFLGMSNSDYCKWIMNNDHWGGGIEVSLLSKANSVEVCVVDTQTTRIDRFGEDEGHSKRILLLYDGIHYDPLAQESLFDGTLKTIFPVSDDQILVKAKELAAECQKSRQFTDVLKFALRCMVCEQMLVGQREAQSHAEKTGHVNFGEV